ncbi:unnamed protein product [Rotaria socialis]|uniref:Uncharacterized protein n=1 Tax=Rotaria socialis TaxID=392032 RepID=A0A818BYT4_9BILA|nr:unnamed protein product [Rotaria socialis]
MIGCSTVKNDYITVSCSAVTKSKIASLMADNNDLFPTEADLLATNYINQRHPPIIALAQTMIGQTESSTLIERAILFHRYMRDAAPFGWSGRFWNETASDVIKNGSTLV